MPKKIESVMEARIVHHNYCRLLQDTFCLLNVDRKRFLVRHKGQERAAVVRRVNFGTASTCQFIFLLGHLLCEYFENAGAARSASKRMETSVFGDDGIKSFPMMQPSHVAASKKTAP
jgi:hypothetical protein